MIQKIAILGDFNPSFQTHHALNDSIRTYLNIYNNNIQFDWIATDVFDCKVVFEKQNYLGLWIAPGSPYKDMNNVLKAIKYIRENNIPTLGNCGGFQHMVIEFAKNVSGIHNPGHEEVDDDSSDLLIKKLSCSLLGEEEHLTILNQKSQLSRIIGVKKMLGRYYCSFGLNEKYVNTLVAHGLQFTSISKDGNYRSFEIESHPFYIGTLFQPALTSSSNDLNPIIKEFINFCLT